MVLEFSLTYVFDPASHFLIAASFMVGSSFSKDLTSSIFLLFNTYNLVSIRLDSLNFILEKLQLTSILKALKLFDFVDGLIKKTLSPSSSDKQNPAFDDGIAKDHAFMTLINAMLSSIALAYVIGCETSKEICEGIESHSGSELSLLFDCSLELENPQGEHIRGKDKEVFSHL